MHPEGSERPDNKHIIHSQSAKPSGIAGHSSDQAELREKGLLTQDKGWACPKDCTSPDQVMLLCVCIPRPCR